MLWSTRIGNSSSLNNSFDAFTMRKKCIFLSDLSLRPIYIAFISQNEANPAGFDCLHGQKMDAILNEDVLYSINETLMIVS